MGKPTNKSLVTAAAGRGIDRARQIRREPPNPTQLATEPESEGVSSLLRLAWDNKLLVTICTLMGVGMAFLAAHLQTPLYRSRISLEVQSFNDDFLNMGKLDPTSVNYQEDSYLQTQLKMLQSESLIDRVKEKVRNSSGDGRFGRLTEEEREEWLKSALKTLRVRGAGLTRVIEVHLETPEPKFSADLANLFANEFIEKSLEDRWNSSQRTTNWLTGQLDGLNTKLREAENRLQAYTRATGMTEADENPGAAAKTLQELQLEISRAQADRLAKQSRYEQALSATEETIPEVLDDGTLGTLYSNYSDLRRQLAELKTVLTPSHSQVKRAAAQLRELEANLAARRRSIMQRISNDYESAKRREGLLREAYQEQLRSASADSQRRVQYELLKREVDSTRQLHDSVLQRVKEAGIASAMRVSNIRVVDPAKVPEKPYSPNRTMYLSLGFLGGGLLGLFLAIGQGRAERRVKNPGEVSGYIALPELGFIISGNGGAYTGALRRLKSGVKNGTDGGSGLELVTWKQQHSAAAESYRSALASILMSAEAVNGKRPRVIMVTSAGPQEGKTTTTCNLGISVAESLLGTDEKVALLDFDFRRPRLHDVFGISRSEGLFELLSQSRYLENPGSVYDWVEKTAVPGLFVIPAGNANAQVSPLLYSAMLGSLLEELRREFNTVLIDTPPILSFATGRLLARWVDSVILVIRSGHTTIDAAMMAKQQFAHSGVPILGTILTDWSPDSKSSHYSRYYYSPYQQKSARGNAG